MNNESNSGGPLRHFRIGRRAVLQSLATGAGAVAFAIFFDSSYTIVVLITLAAAIALLGPGAFSVDARLFGRREIRIG